jgi:hypothetical protein
MICLVKDGSGYVVKTELQLSEVQAKLLTEFRIPDNALFIITYTGRELNIGYTDNVGQYGLLLNLEDGSGVVQEDYGAVGYSVTHYANGEVKQEVRIGYTDGG